MTTLDTVSPNDLLTAAAVVQKAIGETKAVLAPVTVLAIGTKLVLAGLHKVTSVADRKELLRDVMRALLIDADCGCEALVTDVATVDGPRPPGVGSTALVH